MAAQKVKLGIIGLGRWARVLTRAAKTSDQLEIVSGFTRTPDKRDAFTKETGIPVILRQGSDLEIGNQILQEGANSGAAISRCP